jgi:putative endonuclease
VYHVYLIRSIQFPDILYVGYTIDVEQRLTQHNSGSSFYTAKHRPWQLVLYLTFIEESTAKEFEKYLKT